MEEKLTDYINRKKNIIHEEMKAYLHKLSIPNRLKDSMLYSLESGGKKLRPVLLAASYQTYSDDNLKKVLSPAIALEMIHTYSLIHDDLPAMDDDDLRRGKPTNHIYFDEATAILAGDALLTYSFEIIAKDSYLTDTQKVRLIQLLSEKSGPKGMVSGQILDMEAEKNMATIEELETIHTLKTGALLNFAVIAGAYLGGASDEHIKYLEEFSYYLGLIFQVQDDILDITGDPEKLGKPVGSDEGNQKSTYPKLLGLDGAKEKKRHYLTKAREALVKADAKESSYLFALTDYLTKRDH